jgi:ArsR family transcriptional regulator
MRKTTELFKALADSNRLRILKMLEVRPLCVCEITEVLSLAPSTVSKHLSILRHAELIWDQKEGKWVNFGLNIQTEDATVTGILALIKNKLPGDDVYLKDANKIRSTNREIICGIK